MTLETYINKWKCAWQRIVEKKNAEMQNLKEKSLKLKHWFKRHTLTTDITRTVREDHFVKLLGSVYRFSGKQITTHRKLSIPFARQRGSGILAQLACVCACGRVCVCSCGERQFKWIYKWLVYWVDSSPLQNTIKLTGKMWEQWHWIRSILARIARAVVKARMLGYMHMQ